LNVILPIVKKYGAAVIGLTIDEDGIPKESDRRLSIAVKIIERGESIGIPRENIIIDSLALTIGSDNHAGVITLETISKVKKQLGVNQTLGASNISFGLPNRMLLNQTFLAIAIAAGLTCPTVDAAKVRTTVLATDLIFGQDNYAMEYIKDYQKMKEIENV